MEQMDNRTVDVSRRLRGGTERESPFEIVKAGDHWSRRMSKQMEPLELIFGW
jgi:hypothetical protein